MKPKLQIPSRKALPAVRWKRPPRSMRAKLLIAFLLITCFSSATILALPYLPHLNFLFRRPKIDASPYQEAAQNKSNGTPAKQSATNPLDEPGDRLVLPAIGVNAPIVEGTNIYVIGKNQGVWRESRAVSPTTPGNMVLAGHRFLYTAKNGGFFYNLPELKNGEKIYVKWRDAIYAYEVYNTRTVLPTQIDIRNNDPNVPKKLTMYTCYPLGSTAKRFVVEARFVQ